MDKTLIDKYLDEANSRNPGPWVDHSYNAGEAARLIAEKCGHLDSDLAYAMGALHDIGRREGRFHIKHVIDGYRFLKSEGYEDLARICLTHSFAIPELDSYFGHHDCEEVDKEFLIKYLSTTEYDDYDRLIQLCDHLALPSGFCLIEKRMIDVALRLGVNDRTVEKWRTVMELQKYFEGIMGCSIYSVLPGIVENTFG